MGKPKIRFKGYTEDWEQRKLSEISDFITKGATPTTYGYDWQESGIPFFRNDAIKDNKFSYGDFSYISEEANEALQRSEIHGDDILVAITGDIGKAGIVPKSIEKGNINQHTARVRIIKDAIPYFVYQSLITDKQQKKYQLIKTGLSMPQLSLQQIRDTIILCPSVEEQSMIGECFINLDNLITLHQRKCDETKKLKKCMLQKMFPKEGEKVPEIRFSGFTGDWKQRKLGDMAISFEYGLNVPAKEYDGKNKYLRITDINEDSHEFVMENVTSPNVDLSMASQYKLSEGDILFARTGASVGKTYIYKVSDGRVYYAGFLIRARIRGEINAEFVYQNTLTDNYNKYITITSQRSGQPGVNAQEYAKYEILVPDREEQDKISAYLRSIDNLITFHQQKCDELKNIKKFMLQNMFVSEK